jgi:hypothetical protein
MNVRPLSKECVGESIFTKVLTFVETEHSDVLEQVLGY